jgi:quercetin dioxygenase-like cupin family protein
MVQRVDRAGARVHSTARGLAFGLSALLLGVMPVKADDHGTPPPVVGELITTSPDDAKLKWSPCPDVFPKGCEVSVLSGDPAKGASDVYLRATPGTDLKDHWHHSPEHVVLVKGKFSVTFADGRKASLDLGAYTLIPAGMPHSARCEGPESCVIFIGFEKPVDAILAATTAAK